MTGRRQGRRCFLGHSVIDCGVRPYWYQIHTLRTSPLRLGVGEFAPTSSVIDPLQSEDDFITHPNVAAVLDVAKPVAQLDAHSVSSTTK